MNTNNIGLKLADGEFYPVLEDGAAAKKRLVVTTVQDGQPSVQIDLYRGQGPTVQDADYIGSLVVEGIPSMAKGEPDIRMDLGLADDGTLTAFAQEASTGASQSLKVSLEALAEEEKYEIPDFEFAKDEAREDSLPSSFSDEDFEGTDSLPPEADSAQLLADVRSEAEAEEARERPKRRTLALVLLGLGIVLVLLVAAFLVYKFILSPPATAKVEPSQPVAQVAPAPAPEPAPAPQAAKVEPLAPAPKAMEAKPAAPVKKDVTFKKPGVSYKIRWGDTLWDLSYAYYRDPWVFMRIAKANKIKNPDLIITGDRIFIPAK